MVTRALQRAVNVKPHEVRALLLSCAYYFFVLSAYYIIRPIRDEMGVAGGVENLQWLFTGTLVGMLIAHSPFAALVARLPRQRFISYTYRFFMANLLLFFVVLKLAPPAADIWIGRIFFVWASVFNLFVVSVFWAFMADVFANEQGKRLFGFIALGGTLGAIVGAAITAFLAEVLGPVQLMLISILLLELAVQCVRWLARHANELRTERAERPATAADPGATGSGAAAPQAEARARHDDAEAPIGGAVLAGVGHVLRSPYLLGICAYMLFYTVTSTVVYFQQAFLVDQHFTDRALRTAFFARIDLAVNVLAMFTQAFLTGRIVKWLGVAVTLTLLPALCVAGFATLGFMPVIAVLVVFQTLRRAGNYAVARPTREVLYTVVTREDRYKAKNFIDTFVYRAGDQIGAWSYAWLGLLGLSMAPISFLAIPIAGAWLAVGYWLGRKQSELAEAPTAAIGVTARQAPAY